METPSLPLNQSGGHSYHPRKLYGVHFGTISISPPELELFLCRISTKQDPAVYFLSASSFAQAVRGVQKRFVPFQSQVAFHVWLYMCCLFIRSGVDRHLDCFQFGALKHL